MQLYIKKTHIYFQEENSFGILKNNKEAITALGVLATFIISCFSLYCGVKID